MVRRNRYVKKRQEKRMLYASLMIGFFLVSLLVADNILFSNYIVTGYGGMVGEITGVSISDPTVTSASFSKQISVDGAIATADVVQSPPLNPTAVQCQIGANLREEKRTLMDMYNITTDNGDGTYTHETLYQYEVEMSLGVTVTTLRGLGDTPAKNISFDITISENAYDMWQGKADDVVAYVVEIYTRSPTTSNNYGKSDGSPSMGGYTFPAIDYEIGESYPYDDMISLEGDVANRRTSQTFRVTANYLDPDIWITTRAETYLYWDIGVDVITFGYWEETGINRNHTAPIEPGLWDWLWDWFGGFGSDIITILLILVVGFIVIKLIGSRKQQLQITKMGGD